MATLKLPYDVLTVSTEQKLINGSGADSYVGRRRRELALFHNLESYHWRISLGEKWDIGLFPWYGVYVFSGSH